MASVVTQLFYCAIVCCVSLSYAIIFAWPSSTLKLFGSLETPLNRPMTKIELYLFGGIPSVTAFLSNPIAGYLMDRLGRKYCNILNASFYMISWVLIAFSNRVDVMLAARLVSGLGGSMYLTVPIYVSEICHKSIRGAATSGMVTFISTGMLVSYLLGGLLQYNIMVYSCLAISTLVVVMLSFLKESPVWLMKKGRNQDAAKSLAFFRVIKLDSKEMLEEISAIQRILNPDIIDETEKLNPEGEKIQTEKEKLQAEEEKLQLEEKPAEKLSTWQFFLKSKSTRRGFMIVMVLYTLGFLQGLVAIQVYAGPMFMKSVPNLSPILCSSLLAVSTMVSGFLASYAIERFGRKSLLIYSSVTAGMFCIILGSQIQLHWGPSFLTVVLVYICLALFSIGSGTVPPVLRVDMFLPEVSSIMTMIVVEYVWLLNFIVLFAFNPLVAAIGLAYVFYIFATVSFVIAVFSAVFVPETKGLTIDAVQLLLTKNKREKPEEPEGEACRRLTSA